jgi:phage-related protein (TIGR01555 family)
MMTGGARRPTPLATRRKSARKAVSKKALHINYEALARASVGDRSSDATRQQLIRKAFAPAMPPPGVLPKSEMSALSRRIGKLRLGMDSTLDAGFDWAAMNGIFAEGLQFMGYQYLSELTQRPEYRRPSSIMAKEMTREWITLHSTADDGVDRGDKIAQIEAEMKRLGVQEMFRVALENDGYFGRAQLFIDMGDFKDRDELKTPLVASRTKIRRGKGIQRLTFVEPIWTYPNWYNADNPLDPAFFKPSTWFVMGLEVHDSRFLTFVGNPVPDLLKPAYSFGGLALSQMLKPYVDNWLRTRQSVSDITHAFSVMVLKTNLTEILNGGAGTEVFARLDLFNRMRDNRGIFALDKDTEEFENVAAPLGSLDKLQAQAQEHMSSVSGIPLIVLFGISPSGLNASSEGELKTFQDWVRGRQESDIGPNLSRILELIQLSLWGEVDRDIGFTFNPLWSLDEKELADVRKVEADTDAVLIGLGAIDPEESRARLAKQKDSPYSSLDLDKVIEPPGQEDLLGSEPEQGGGLGEPGASPAEFNKAEGAGV